MIECRCRLRGGRINPVTLSAAREGSGERGFGRAWRTALGRDASRSTSSAGGGNPELVAGCGYKDSSIASMRAGAR